jgi:GcrA cell cycle regulator
LFNWSDYTERLRQWWQIDGMSASEIAAKIGITRNSVIGRVSRLGLSKGRPPREPKKRIKPLGCRKPRAKRNRFNYLNFARQTVSGSEAAAALPLPLEPPLPLLIPFIETTEDQCRFIVDDQNRCCGHKTLPFQSWCPDCSRRVFLPPQRRLA